MMYDVFINNTKNWINEVVIQHNLCPFARKVQIQGRIDYRVDLSEDLPKLMTNFLEYVELMNRIPTEKADTAFFIVPNGLDDFEEYLDFIAAAEDFVIQLGYEGVFQIATFHPKYQFAGTANDDVENYTNRSPYPMLHILREGSVEKALESYENPEEIPVRNVETMKRLGLEYFESKS